MELIRKVKPSNEFPEFFFPEYFDPKKIEMIENDIKLMSATINGIIWIPEYVVNKHSLTPRHFTENWENVNVELNNN